MESIPSGGFLQAKILKLCVSGNSPDGNYTFVNTQVNRNRYQGATQDGAGLALTGNGSFWSSATPPPGGPGDDKWYDPGDGGDGITTVNSPEGTPYILAKSGALPACVDVLTRNQANDAFMAKIPQSAGGPCVSSCGGVADPFAAATILFTSASNGATYNHTDCLLDNGVLIPQQANPPASFLTWPNPSRYVCDDHNNPTRGFANYEHGAKVTFFFGAPPILATCTLGYSDDTHLPESRAAFNESEVLTGFALVSSKLHAWYSDEHALTLGVDAVFKKNKNSPDEGFHYDIELMAGHGNPGPLTSSVTGNPIKTGRAPGATDAPTNLGNPVDGAGRPLAPGLYLTDLTLNGPTSRIGDWQQGGTPVSPNALYGTWKGALVTIDNTKNPAQTKLVPGPDPAKNHKVVGTGGLNPPANTQDFGYSSDIVWNLTDAPFIAHHDYRAQVIVHDGDQNKTGGDVGQACINIDQN